jgi:hypothetical protein
MSNAMSCLNYLMNGWAAFGQLRGFIIALFSNLLGIL